MRNGFICVAILILISSSAYAAAYDDFTFGVAAKNRGDGAAAITYLTLALNASDLAQSLRPVAYLDRGLAYMSKHACAMAQSDFTAASALKPDYFEAYVAQSEASNCLGHTDEMIAAYNKAVLVLPNAVAYFGRGRMFLLLGRYADAVPDMRQAVKLDPNNPYPVLWLWIASARAGSVDESEFDHDVSHLNLQGWPEPILDLFAGNTTPDTVMGREDEVDDDIKRGQDCEANFYIGEWQMVRKHADAALPLFKAAAKDCPENFIEYSAASAELARMK